MTKRRTDTLNEDWIKTMHWDIGFDFLDGLLHHLGVADATDASQKAAVRKFLARPVAAQMPDNLRQEVSHRWPDLEVAPQTPPRQPTSAE